MTIANKNTNFLNFPQMLGAKIEKDFPGLYQWFMSLGEFISTKFSTQGDVTCLTPGTGLVLNSPSSTGKVTLSDDGNNLELNGTPISMVGVPGPQGADGPPGAPGAPGIGIATGGTTGQILVKNSNTPYDTAWADLPTFVGYFPIGWM